MTAAEKETQINSGGDVQKKKKKILSFLPLYFMMLPGFIYLIINNYIPMAGIVIAFKKYNVKKGIFGSDWVGLSNFEYLFGTQDSLIIIRNTLLYNISFIIVNMVVGVILAIMITDVLNKKMRKIYQSSILIPFTISIVVVSYIVFAFLSQENGMLNKSILPFWGREAVNWYSEPKYWPGILIFVNCWKGVGYGTLLYIAAIVGIDKGFYEAARLDGASKWQEIRYITLPLIQPTVVTLLLLGIGRIFYSDFGLFYQVPQNSGALFSVTNTIDTYVYRALISSGGIGRSSAAGVFQSIVGFVLVMISNWVTKKLSPENAIF